MLRFALFLFVSLTAQDQDIGLSWAVSVCCVLCVVVLCVLCFVFKLGLGLVCKSEKGRVIRLCKHASGVVLCSLVTMASHTGHWEVAFVLLCREQ